MKLVAEVSFKKKFFCTTLEKRDFLPNISFSTVSRYILERVHCSKEYMTFLMSPERLLHEMCHNQFRSKTWFY